MLKLKIPKAKYGNNWDIDEKSFENKNSQKEFGIIINSNNKSNEPKKLIPMNLRLNFQ